MFYSPCDGAGVSNELYSLLGVSEPPGYIVQGLVPCFPNLCCREPNPTIGLPFQDIYFRRSYLHLLPGLRLLLFVLPDTPRIFTQLFLNEPSQSTYVFSREQTNGNRRKSCSCWHGVVKMSISWKCALIQHMAQKKKLAYQ
jgi:hypothetical protein